MTEPPPPQDRVELHIRGLPEWLIRKYLGEMGATGDSEDTPEMHTDTWAVTWTTQHVPIAGSSGIGLTQFDITFTAEPAVLSEVETQFMKKAQRGGG